MKFHRDLTDLQLRRFIKRKTINYAGNGRLKIYGTLHCSSGKRMKKENRVFFESEKEATQNGYRPCGHCMREGYLNGRAFNLKKTPHSQFHLFIEKIKQVQND